MPRNVRNFWIELVVDGRAQRIETGPQNKEGGFTLRVRARDKGGIIEVGRMSGRATGDGVLFIDTEMRADHLKDAPSPWAHIRTTTER